MVAIFFFFIALTSAYVIRQNTSVVDTSTGEMINTWRPIVIPPLLWINTLLLLASSATIELARRHMFREPQATQEWLGMGAPARAESLPWVGITLVLGIGFLAGQFVAWRQLNAQGIYLASNPSSAFFFILTGAHAVHLIGGVGALMWAAIASLRRTRLQSRQIVIDVSAWYWHGMGALWIYIFAVLYWMR
jgi:cytochrome c oxidase subunit III